MAEGEPITMWKSSSLESNSMVSATVGRVISSLLTARPKKLSDAIYRLDSAPRNAPLSASLKDLLWILYKYVRDSADKEEESFDHVLVPMIEHSLKWKESKHGNQTMILLDWLFQDDNIFQALATNFASILLRKSDQYISLGWCILARGLIEYDITTEQLRVSGIREKYIIFLKILGSCVEHLLSIVCNGSTLQGGFELPTRLAVAAADCVIALTIALTRKDIVSGISVNSGKPSKPFISNLSITLGPDASGEKKTNPPRTSSEVSSNMEMGLLLWNLLDEVIILVQRLIAWSRKSRSLHAKGLERVLKWLQETKRRNSRLQAEAGPQMVKAGALLLSSCWKHCSILLHLEDHKFSQHYRELLDQYLSGIQFYAENYAEEIADNKGSGIETINFFLNCLLLLLGRCNAKQFESAISEYGLQMSRVLIPQLRSPDEDVIDGAVCLIKAAMFRTDSSLGGSSLIDLRQMDAVLPLLLLLLDERDGTARAAVMLLAEYCLLSLDSRCLEEVLKRLSSGNVSQRRNAIDVISELIQKSSASVAKLSPLMWQDISHHLLERLEDEESLVCAQASVLLSMIEPSLVLPPLVRLVYSSDERVQRSACNTLVAVLKTNNERSDAICMLLDCLSKLGEGPDLPDAASDGKGLKLDTESVLKLIPERSKTVEDWNLLSGPLIDKMLAEPSNATIVRFLSYISENLAEASDVVFQRLLLHARGQKEIHSKGDSIKQQHSLFDRLCPLLIIRLLPLRVFDDLQSSLLYGDLVNQHTIHETRYFNIRDAECVASLLLNRAFNKFEFEDVRKLAAELCGRIHQHVLYPIIYLQLENAASFHDVLKIKTCLFAICTSLMARGKVAVWHSDMLKIREIIKTVLLWPSIDADEVSKAQHGCIDCLALMICTELQAPESFKDSSSAGTHLIEKNSSPDQGKTASKCTVLTYVISQLTSDKNEHISSSKMNAEKCTFEETLSLPFRLCMANVLISACQKIPDSGRKRLAKKILPRIIRSTGAINDSEIRAACIQILFSAVYHLKSVILPYSSDLLKVSLKALQQGSEKERTGGAKLMTSLLASEDSVVECISGGLLEARALLSSIALGDPSPDLRQMCQKMLLCLTPS